MRSQHYADETVIGSRLLLPKLWQRLAPILLKNRGRVALAVLCLLGAKVALMYIPFLLKALVDGLDTDPNQLAMQAILILVLAYGAARLTTTLFGEIRDTLFGRVTEKAMHEISLSTFKHVHSLDLEYHLNRRTGGLARDIERGTDGISFLLRFFIFNSIFYYFYVSDFESFLGGCSTNIQDIPYMPLFFHYIVLSIISFIIVVLV